MGGTYINFRDLVSEILLLLLREHFRILSLGGMKYLSYTAVDPVSRLVPIYHAIMRGGRY